MRQNNNIRPDKKEEAPNLMGFHRGPGSGGMRALLRAPKVRPKQTKKTIGRLWGYLKTQRAGLIMAFFLVFTTTALNIINPYLIKIALDEYIIQVFNLPALSKIIMLMMVIHLATVILSPLQQWIMITITQKAIRNLRSDVFHHFQLLSVRFFDNHAAGDLMSRITNDIENISNTISSSLIEFFSGILSIAGVTVLMLTINWQLAIICLGIIPLVVLVTGKIARHTRKGFQDQQKYLGELNGLIEESVSGQKVVKAFTKEAEYIRIFSELNQKLRKASRTANMYAGFMGPIMNMMNNLNYGLTAFAGGVLALYNLVSIGTIAAFLSYTRQFARPLNHIAQLYNGIQSALAGAERVFAMLDELPEIEENSIPLSPGKPDRKMSGTVVFKDLHFNYNPGTPVLKGINLEVRAGQTIALVGPTGAGKTTIVNVLTRFYDYHKGIITIDGVEIKRFKKSELRKMLGIVLQDTFLFSDSVKENIRYGRLDATDDEIINAAKLAYAHQFIHRMPGGYDTEISEAGNRLSQGQRQLIAIARAILSDPAVLILDEATSSVDTRTEIHIQEAMLKLMEGRTSFVIAHRLSTIKNADKILVMDDGRIIEQGTHHELLQKQGFYYRLYTSQFRT